MAIVFWENREEKILNRNLFSETAEKLAKSVASRSSQQVNSPTQIRRFFDEIVSFDAKYNNARNKYGKEEQLKVFKQQLPFLHMLVPKVKYAEARKLVTSEFTNMICDIISELKEPEDIKIFTSFFEAFVGHYRYAFEMKKQQDEEARRQNRNTSYNTSNQNRGRR
jgi:CRISPR-associated protein Csm2